MSFEQMHLSLATQSDTDDSLSVRDQNNRLNLTDLVQRAFDVGDYKSRLGPRATLSSRAALALLVPLLPILALGLAIPPKRGTTAFGIGLGIGLIVTYVQLSKLIENRATVTSPVQSALLLTAFAGLAILLFQANTKMGAGFVESLLQRVFAPVSRSLARLFAR